MKAVIIGANSYIARNLLKFAMPEALSDLALCDIHPRHMDGASGYRQIDFSDPAALGAAVAGADVIYFFTGMTGTLRGFQEPETFLTVNEGLLLRLLDALKASGSKARVVFPSTRLVYRGGDRPLDEDAPKAFLTPYAIQKYACEQYLQMYQRLYGVGCCVLRICVPYGTLAEPVSSYGTADFFLRDARDKGQITVYGDGTQRRSFTYIGDLAAALWQAGDTRRLPDGVYNVGGEDLSIAQAAECIAKVFGAKLNFVPWPPEALALESGSTVFDSRRLDGYLGLAPQMTLARWAETLAKL